VIKTFINRPVFTAMLLLAVVVFGLVSWPRIGVDNMPNVEVPVITVTTVLPGADPETVERNVSKELEEALNTISGLDTIQSQNYESVSVVILQFDLEVPLETAANDVREKVQAAINKLPREAEAPKVQKVDLGALPIVQLAISGPLPIEQLTRTADDDLKPALQRLQGVGSIDVVGGRKREIAVVVDPIRLRAHGIAATDVSQAIAAQSIAIPGGRTTEPSVERVVKLETEAASVDELRDLVIAAPMGKPIRIRDVANVIDGPAEARSVASLDGKQAVALVVRKQSGANTVAVAERVKEAIPELQALLPKGARIEVVADNARFIRNSIDSVQEDMIIGALLAVLVVLVFLRDWRSTIVSAVALPTSIIGTFAAMRALNFTFNNVTMLALTLSIGLLIDDAIVVIENIVRRLEHGEEPRTASQAGTSQIALAVLAVTLSVIAVFVPVAFMQGMIGRFFFQFGITVTVAVAISYAVSMTLTPMMSARVLKAHHAAAARGGERKYSGVGARLHGVFGPIRDGLEAFFSGMEARYRKLLTWALDHRRATIGIASGIMALTVLMLVAGLVKTSFFPPQDMSIFQGNLEMPSGTPLQVTQAEGERLSAAIREIPGVQNVFLQVGGGIDEAVNKVSLTVNLVPRSARRFSQEDAKNWIREHLKASGGGNLTVADPSMGFGGRTQPIQFSLRSDDWPALLKAVDAIHAKMKDNKGFVDVDHTYRGGKPLLSVRLDRERAAAVGLPAAVAGQTLRAFLGGDKFTSYREKGDQFDVRLRLPESVRSDPKAVAALPIRTPGGQIVELRSVANIVQGTGPSQIDRQALKRQVVMLADLKSTYAEGDAQAFLKSQAKELPATIQTGFEGRGKEFAKMGKNFLFALILGIVLVYMVLGAQFESLLDPFTIMMALPLSVIGAILGLLISREFMSMFAMIGMIMLAGLVTKNGILIVEFTNQLRDEGRSVRDALLEAGPLRLRPILMTTVAMVAGMLPVAFARGDGAESRTGMAWAIIGGLIASTFLTLLIVPVIYSLLDRLRRKHAHRDVAVHEHATLSPVAAAPTDEGAATGT
jgi:HAE1 family hydrophobic/amphiphilic exporter-1